MSRRRSWRCPLDRLSSEVRGQLGRFGPQGGPDELLARWTSAVGENVARNAWPARIGRDGTLHVHTKDSIWAFELGHRSTELAERLGVSSVRFAPGTLPVDEEPVALIETAVPTPEQQDAAAEIAAGITDGALRESVQKAVSLGLARASSDRPV